MKKIFIFILITLLSLVLFSQKKVVENISVDWWVVPLFAVDKTGNSILDLTKNDIELLVDKKRIDNFTLYKRPFNVERKISVKEKIIPQIKRKIVFLIFDTAFTTIENLERATSIAKDLVSKGAENTRFVIMIVDPLSGLQYRGGPSNDTGILNGLIDKVVKINTVARNVETTFDIISGAQISGTKGDKYSGEDVQFFAEEISSGLRNTNKNFFFSFESLYYSLNQITDNKFIYFFSEGLSLYSRKSVRHAEEEYFHNLKKSADFMGKSGSVIFMIDPTGFESANIKYPGPSSVSKWQSGTDSLKYLASESGGKYLRGNTKDLSKKLEKMNRAYYELAFTDEGLSGKKIKDVLIKPKRKGLKIHTLKNLEKKKRYTEMNNIEKEVLVINLINKSLYFDPPLKIKKLNIVKVKKEIDKIIYSIKMPSNFRGKYIDIFRVWIEEEEYGKTIVENEKLLTSDKTAKITVAKRGNSYGKIVLVNIEENLALVQGEFEVDIKLNAFIKKHRADFKKNLKKMSESKITELEGLLSGAAEYSKKLEESAFHFVCKEEAVEIIKEIGRLREKRESKYDYRTGVMINKRVMGKFDGSIFNKRSRKYIFDYQLIQNGDKVEEQRKLLTKVKNKKDLGKIINIESFISKKIVLTPAALLSLLNQDKFEFRLVKYEKVKGVKAAVVEIFPKEVKKAGSIFGKVWIDVNDFSVIRIIVNPISIGGFKNILAVSAKLGSFIDLKCRIDFFKERNGIRFPTMVRIIERHIGGPVLKDVLRIKIWERSKTTYKYSDYKFFDVETEVKINNDK